MSDEAPCHCSPSSFSIHFCRHNKPGHHRSKCLKYHHVLERGPRLLDLRCKECIKDAHYSAFAKH